MLVHKVQHSEWILLSPGAFKSLEVGFLGTSGLYSPMGGFYALGGASVPLTWVTNLYALARATTMLAVSFIFWVSQITQMALSPLLKGWVVGGRYHLPVLLLRLSPSLSQLFP